MPTSASFKGGQAITGVIENAMARGCRQAMHVGVGERQTIAANWPLRGCENIERRREAVSRRSRQGALREKWGSLVS